MVIIRISIDILFRKLSTNNDITDLSTLHVQLWRYSPCTSKAVFLLGHKTPRSTSRECKPDICPSSCCGTLAPRPALARGLALAHPRSLPHGTWPHDAGIRVTRVEDISQLLCGTITISATGEAARVQPPPWHASPTRTLSTV